MKLPKSLTRQQINRALKKNFRELDRAYLNLLGSSDEKLTAIYQKVFEEIKTEIAKIYEKFGDKPTITQLRKYNRLINFEKQIADKIKELDKELRKYINTTIKETIINANEATGEIFNESFTVDFFKLGINKKQLEIYLSDNLWYDSIQKNNVDLWTSVKREFETVLRANAREEIIAGIMEGKSYRDVIKSIQERFDVSYNRAKTITFTEMHKAHIIGRNEGIKEAQEILKEAGMKGYKVWKHNTIGQPRPEHLEADGQKADEEGFFYVGGERLEAPGLGTDPANNINCHCSVEFEVDF